MRKKDFMRYSPIQNIPLVSKSAASIEKIYFFSLFPGQISMVAATFILATLLIITFVICSYLGL